MKIIISLNFPEDNIARMPVVGNIDYNFAHLWEKVWMNWRDKQGNKIDVFNPNEWKKHFGSKIITRPNGDWAAIEFKSKKEYVLFMLTWG